ncbi:hypothetical protein KIW84_023158 [Lathyrus oleraceus]|uniref:Uncharacterized protein n=1 Tax=Pisum sativum TaxID=3888 RepID=A0A9D4YC91_PEA|nr:hypothetical protein KIW84_023153 [Pisum sativum]KAI5436922.1 hypothetical protein KIW84_023158 [Pisum sativum]
MDKHKVHAFLEWQTPANVKQLRGLLGLTGYYRRFIKSYATIASPLTDLLRKDNFCWSPSAHAAFLTLKQAITSAPLLVLPDFSQTFILETDASGSGIRAVLSQQGHPIAYFSKKLGPNVQKQSAYLREFRANTKAMAKLKHYLLGHKFITRTDQKSLKAVLDQSLQTPEQQAWLHKFFGFDFTIEYKPGKENVAADSLSRMFVLAWSEPQQLFLPEPRTAIRDCPHFGPIFQACLTDEAPHLSYAVKDSLLCWNDRLAIPSKSSLIPQVLQEYHNSFVGITRTIARICSQFYWPQMKHDITEYVKLCTICQQAEHYFLASRVANSITYSNSGLGGYCHGFYNRIAQLWWFYCHICGCRQTYQIWPFLSLKD